MTINSKNAELYAYVIKDADILTQINYVGTRADWESIPKHEKWAVDAEIFTVFCSDGEIKYPLK